MIKKSLISSLALALALGVGVSAAQASDTNLYHRLGGKKAINAIVIEFINNINADNRISVRFAHTDLVHLKKMLDAQICADSGGPCKYKGKSMKDAHAGMNIQDSEFNALVEDLVKALDEHKVQDKEKNDLLDILGPMKPDIVGQ